MQLKRLKAGRWQVRWRDRDRKQRARNFTNKEVAQDFLRELMTGEHLDRKPEATTFRTFAERWHRDYCRVEKAESQWVSDWNLIRIYLLPAFGDLELSELRKVHLLNLRARLRQERALSVKSVNLITALARKMLNTAIDWELLRKNPWGDVTLLRQPEQPIAYWTIAERDAFLAHCRQADPEFADIVEFACHTGMRLGEIRGLRRDCLDFDRGVITVRRGWARDLRGVEQLLDYTKGKSIRDIKMNEVVLGILRPSRRLGPAAHIFEFDPHHVARRLQRLAIAAGVKPIRFHDLRHTFASHMAMAGVPLYKIQRLLGHIDTKQTQRYAHLSPESLEGLTECLVSARNVHLQVVGGSK